MISVHCAEPPAAGSLNQEPTPQQEDAQLYDVQFVGSRIGWAVGELGTIWQTTGGGQSWKFKPSPARCTFRSICFLTDKIGWIVGGGGVAYTNVSAGTVLATTDGGATWRQLGRDELPELHRVKFFTRDLGFATG